MRRKLGEYHPSLAGDRVQISNADAIAILERRTSGNGTGITSHPTPGYWYKVTSEDIKNRTQSRTLSDIAARCHVSEALLRSVNTFLKTWMNVNDQIINGDSRIKVGDLLYIPRDNDLRRLPPPTKPRKATPQKTVAPETVAPETATQETQTDLPPTPTNPAPVAVFVQPLLAADKGKYPRGTFIVEIESDDGTLVCTPFSARFASGADVAARSWSCSFRWNPYKSSHFDWRTKSVVASSFNAAVKSGSFATARCYVDGQLRGSGFLLSRTYNLTGDASSVTCEFYSRTKHLIDGYINPNITVDPTNYYTDNNLYLRTMRQIAESVAEGFAVRFWTEDIDEATGKEHLFDFNAPRAGSEKIMTFLQRLAMSRGMFVKDDAYGNIVFHKLPNAPEGYAGALVWGGRSATEWSATYDDSCVFGEYIAYTQGDNARADGTRIVMNPALVPHRKDGGMWAPRTRRLIFQADNEFGAIKDAAQWFVAKSWLDAHSFQLPVGSIYGGDGEIWEDSTIVQVNSPICENTDNNDMAIRGVELIFNDDERSAVLSLCPTFYVKDGELQALSGEATFPREAAEW